MAFDAARQTVVMFGGEANGVFLADTWEWTPAGWTQRNAQGPVARQGHAMAYDSVRQRTVLFGGVTQASQNLADTWEWNGSAWIPRFSSVVPPARNGHGMAFDPLRGRTVVVGGSVVSSTASDRIWEWDGTNWFSISAQTPVASNEVVAAFDVFHGKTMLRGLGGSLWWDGAALTSSTAGLVVNGGVIAYDDARQRMVHFGGGVPFTNTYSGDTYELWYAPRPASVTPYGAGCGAPPLGLAAAANASPRIGTTFRADITNVPFSAPFVAFGLNDQYVGPFPLPLVLDGFGYLGCLLHHDAFLSLPCTQQTAPSTAAYDLAIPNVPALLTSVMYLQAWSLAPGVNAGGAVLSNGLRIVIGNS